VGQAVIRKIEARDFYNVLKNEIIKNPLFFLREDRFEIKFKTSKPY